MKSLVRLCTRYSLRISGNSAASRLDKATGRAKAAHGLFISGVRRAVRRLLPAVAMLAALGIGSAGFATAQATQFLNWTTQVGGSAIDGAIAVALDGSGNVYAITFTPEGSPTIAVKIPASDPTCSTPSDCIQIASNFTWATPFGGTEYPETIAVDGSGNVFLSSGVQLIEVPSTDLTCSTLSDCIQLAGSNAGVSAMAADSRGDLYIATDISGTNEVLRFTPSGNSYTSSTLFTLPSGTLVKDLAVDAGGDVYLLENSAIYSGDLVEYSVSSSYTPTIVISHTTIDTTIGLMDGVTLDASGNYYVVNGAYQLFEVTPSGTVYTLSTNDAVGLSLAVDASGNIYNATGNGGDTLFEIHSGPVNFGSVNVGTTSAAIQLSYLIGAAGGVAGPSPVLTQGATGPDFAASSQVFPGTDEYSPCSVTANPGGICTVYVKFTPAKAGLREGSVDLLSHDVTLAPTLLQGIGVAPQAVIYPGTETTLFNSTANGLSDPTGLAVDSSGNVYIADTGNGRVLKETLSGGSYTQSVVQSGLSYPAGVAVDGAGDLYVSQQVSGFVQQLTLASDSYTVCCNVANSALNGLVTPSGVAVDGGGNVYIADQGNNRVLMETLSDGFYNQSTVFSALNDSPSGVAVDSSGNVYIAASGNNTVYKETLSGGSYTQSVIGSGMFVPESVAVDGAGDVYVADTFNNRILLEAYSNGVYTQSVLLSSGLSFPEGLALDGNGNLYIADSGNNRVLKLDVADPQTLTFDTTLQGATSSDSPQTATLLNIGNATLTIPNPSTGTNPSIPANFTVGNAEADCDLVHPASFVPGSLAAGASCLLPISFTPGDTEAGSVSGSLVLTDNSLNAGAPSYTSQSIQLQGTDILVPAALTSPTPGSTLTGSSATFTWSAGVYVTKYEFRLGTTGPGSKDVYNSAEATTTALTSGLISNIPTNAATLYARLYSYIDGAWQYTDYTYTEFGTPTPATLLTPTPGSTLGGTSATFTWSTGVAVTMYEFRLGTTGPGSRDVYNSAEATTTALSSGLVSNIPANAATLYARLYSKINGAWQYNDYTYTEFGTPTPAALLTPTPGSTLTASGATFTWSAGTGVSYYELRVGTTGPGSSNVYNAADATTNALTSGLVSNIPTTGAKLYARLYSKINGAWQYNDYTYTESLPPAPAVLIYPTPGSTLTGSSAAFVWSSGVDVTMYEFRLGTTGPGSRDLYNSAEATTTSLTSGLVSNIPIIGATLYARLYSLIGGTWQYTDYTYTESSVPAALTAPTPGSTLTGSSATFTWSAGVDVAMYEFRLGTTGPGSTNLYNSAEASTTALTSGLISSIPTTAATLYARLYSLIGGAWQYTDYTYTEFGTPVPAALTSPTPGSTLTGSSATFTWSAGTGVTMYELRLGTTGPGSNNVYNSADATTTALSSGLVSNIPTTGATLYARLYSYINGAWQYTDYTYTEWGPAALISPAPGSKLTGSSATFTWSAGSGVTMYKFLLGTTVPGSSDVYNSAGATTTALTSGLISNIPTNGGTLYARIYSWINGAWQYNDYTYIEFGTAVPAVLTGPGTDGAPDGMLTGPSATFTWSTGVGVTMYEFQLGTSGSGSSNLYNGAPTTALTSGLISNIPTNGAEVYARIYSLIDGVWQFKDYLFVEKYVAP